jgi:hypothetical protein
MTRASELRRRADRFRQMIRFITDSRAVRALRELVGEFEMTAEQLERHQLIRERAHAIWIARGRPVGQDVENWLTAECELGESLANLQPLEQPRPGSTGMISTRPSFRA